MRRSVGKNTLVVMGVVGLSIIALAVIAALVHNWLSRPQTVAVSDSQLIESYKKKYPSVEEGAVTVDKYITYAEQWVIADIAFTVDRSRDSEGDDDHQYTGTRCVFIVESDNIDTVACSSEGFYESDFSDSTPSNVIERANQPL